MELGCFGWFEFFEGCVFMCVSLHRRLFLASFFPRVKNTTIVLNALKRMIRRVNIGRI